MCRFIHFFSFVEHEPLRLTSTHYTLQHGCIVRARDFKASRRLTGPARPLRTSNARGAYDYRALCCLRACVPKRTSEPDRMRKVHHPNLRARVNECGGIVTRGGHREWPSHAAQIIAHRKRKDLCMLCGQSQGWICHVKWGIRSVLNIIIKRYRFAHKFS